MRETFKNISIFIVFVICLILWRNAERYLGRHFDFEYGRTVWMCLWSIGVIVLFHLLYHFLGRSTEKAIYLSTLLVLIGFAGLVYFDKVAIH